MLEQLKTLDGDSWGKDHRPDDRVVEFRIVVGAEYIYASGFPLGVRGHRYKVLGLVVDVPSYQEKVLVEALTGPDKGLQFVCSPSNFSTRYVAA